MNHREFRTSVGFKKILMSLIQATKGIEERDGGGWEVHHVMLKGSGLPHVLSL